MIELPTPRGGTTMTDADYRTLSEFRRALRQFMAFSERAARDAGLTPAHHQLLLAIRGHHGDAPSTTDVAASLGLRLHSAGELVGRAVEHGLVVRHHDATDARRTRLTLTAAGQEKLAELSELHRRELRRFRSEMAALLDALD